MNFREGQAQHVIGSGEGEGGQTFKFISVSPPISNFSTITQLKQHQLARNSIPTTGKLIIHIPEVCYLKKNY